MKSLYFTSKGPTHQCTVTKKLNLFGDCKKKLSIGTSMMKYWEGTQSNNLSKLQLRQVACLIKDDIQQVNDGTKPSIVTT